MHQGVRRSVLPQDGRMANSGRKDEFRIDPRIGIRPNVHLALYCYVALCLPITYYLIIIFCFNMLARASEEDLPLGGPMCTSVHLL